MYIVQNAFTMHQNLCIVSVQRTFPRNETYLKAKSMNVKGVHCTVYTVHCTKYFHKASESVKNRQICKTCHTFSGVVRVGTSPFLYPHHMNFCPPYPSTTNWYPNKMPQSQKRTKCHNVDGEIRMQQKCYKDITKVLQGCNMV